MRKFKIGDRVRIIAGGWGFLPKYVGEEVTITDYKDYFGREGYIVEPKLESTVVGEESFELVVKKAVHCKTIEEWNVVANKLGRTSAVIFESVGNCIKIDNPNNSHFKGKNPVYKDISFEEWCYEEGMRIVEEKTAALKKDSMEEVLKEAKKRYPIGTVCIDIDDSSYIFTITKEVRIEYGGISHKGIPHVFYNGVWAKIVSSPKELIIDDNEKLLPNVTKQKVVEILLISQ